VIDINFYLAFTLTILMGLIILHNQYGSIKIFLNCFGDILSDNDLFEIFLLWLVTLFVFVAPIPLWKISINGNISYTIILCYWLLNLLAKVIFSYKVKLTSFDTRFDLILYLIIALSIEFKYQALLNGLLVIIISNICEDTVPSKSKLLINNLNKLSLLMMLIILGASTVQQLYVNLFLYSSIYLLSIWLTRELVVFFNPQRIEKILGLIGICLSIARVYT